MLKVLTCSHYQKLFQQEVQRLSVIDIDTSYHSEFSNKTLAKFGGARHEDVVKWLSDVEEIFNRAQFQLSNKYLAVQSYLIDSAAKWFRYNKATIIDWSTFKIELVKAYQPSLLIKDY
ncbi:unnamed protein product [Rotaria sp. Silwood2]|nr:unnamed protein product [Rotaria sp. Silwood2]CAF2729855.1 unnamed protein product [Rotaria sp. Silwood2]CAF2977788.1 unnamed protein product [Rotaria sp. Silwood2]CAF3138482.1 unnamed protein product [Rotaria sp. Silwood2]CAF4334684.1 unnamed protein product [Rotaria sp. Silwood2]